MSDQNPYQPEFFNLPPAAEQPQTGTVLGISSLVLGIIGLAAWCIPCCGLPITTVGLVMGVLNYKARKNGLAVALIILNIIGLLLTLTNTIWGAYLKVNGLHQPASTPSPTTSPATQPVIEFFTLIFGM